MVRFQKLGRGGEGGGGGGYYDDMVGYGYEGGDD